VACLGNLAGQHLHKVNTMSIETMTAAVISTGHLTKKSMDSAPWGFPGAQMTYGAIVWCNTLDFEDVPEDVRDVFTWAQSMGFEWVRFDCDAREVSGLRTYHWEEEA
jgi:hypothetical protein